MKVRILLSAFNDLVEGREFYDQQAEDLGEYFFNTVFSEIDSLMLYGGSHSRQGEFFRKLSKTFPYAIYYQIFEGDVVVFRVLDCRQNPQKIRRKLRTND